MSRVGVVAAILAVAVVLGFLGPEAASAEPDNPTPVITTLSPGLAAISGPAFTLTVNGSGFVAGSVVQWNGQPRPTTFGSEGQLTAEIGVADVAAAAVVAVTVFNPAPGGGVSASAEFLVKQPNPLPEVTGLSPAQALAGDGSLSLTVVGGGFVPGSAVLWNGEERATGFINETVLSATIRASDLSLSGLAFVSVLSPPPGGGQSLTARVFTIIRPGPAAARVEPASVWAGDSGFTLAVMGSSFTPASVVQWAGVDQATVYVSSERLEAWIPSTQIMHSGAASVRVFTPAPGGGLSATLFMDVQDDGVAPVTTVSGPSGTWHRTTAKFDLTATDVGLGVEKTFHRLDGSGAYSDSGRATIRARRDHKNDGMHTLEFFSIDKVLNWEFPVRQMKVGIDTRRPQTRVRDARVKRFAYFRPRYKVYDVTSPRARDAELVVSTMSGKVVMRRYLGRPLMRRWRLGPDCKASLRRGRYRMRVLAHDLAGNAQYKKVAGILTVY